MKEINVEFYLTNITFQLSIYCYFAFIPFFEVEVQPYSIVPAFFYLLLYRFPFKKEVIVFFIIIIIYFIAAIIFFTYDVTYPIGGSVVSLLSFIIPIVVFCSLYGNIDIISSKGFFVTFYIWFIVGFLQTYFSSFLQSIGFELLIQTFIGRFRAGAISDNRGITFLAPEPAGAAYPMILFFIFLVYLWYKKDIGKFRFYSSLSLLTLMIIWNKSGTAILVFFIFGLIYMIINARFVYVIYLSVIAILISVILQMDFIHQYRGLQLISESVEFVTESQMGIIDYINSTGSIREIGVIVGYNTILNGHIFGVGLGSWKTQFINEMTRQGFDPRTNPFFQMTGMQDIKPAAYVAAIAFDTGIIGVSCVFYFFIGVYKDIQANLVRNKTGISIFVFSIVMIFFHTMVSLPIFWIIACIGVDLMKNKNQIIV